MTTKSSQAALDPGQLLADEILDEKAAAAFMHLSVRSLQAYRVDGTGPRFVKLGARRIGYFRSEILKFLRARVFSSTAEADAARAAREAGKA